MSTRPRRMSITDDLRRRIVDAHLGNMDYRLIANAFGIPRTTVEGILRTYRLENRVTSKKRGRAPREKLSQEDKEVVKQWVDDDCSLTLRVIKEGLRAERGVRVSESTISRCLKAFHYTVKRIRDSLNVATTSRPSGLG